MATKTRPKTKPAPTSRRVLSGQLRAAILDRGLTAYALGRDAGVDAGVIQRFLNGERDIRMETADRLAEVLGLRLVEAARGRGRPSRPGARRDEKAPSPGRPRGLGGGLESAVGAQEHDADTSTIGHLGGPDTAPDDGESDAGPGPLDVPDGTAEDGLAARVGVLCDSPPAEATGPAADPC